MNCGSVAIPAMAAWRKRRRYTSRFAFVSPVPLAAGAQLRNLLASHLLGAHVVRLDYAVQRHLAGFENDPMARPHIGAQGTRVAIQFPEDQYDHRQPAP